MPLTTLDPNTALIVIDLQKGIVNGNFIVTGVVTSGGVEATARQAYEQGFNVTLALDAMTDIREEAHEYSIRNVFPRLGETGSTQEIISLLERRSSAS